tara:strand:+ start:963 stop:1178 length:216 start_codon:yes stop_codon:yes gene_type:complete
MEELYWTTKDGTRILVDDMTESHLRNALKMIIRRINQEKQIRRKQESMQSYKEKVMLNAALHDYGFDPNWD